jgi:hypothetical protein
VPGGTEENYVSLSQVGRSPGWDLNSRTAERESVDLTTRSRSSEEFHKFLNKFIGNFSLHQIYCLLQKMHISFFMQHLLSVCVVAGRRPRYCQNILYEHMAFVPKFEHRKESKISLGIIQLL